MKRTDWLVLAGAVFAASGAVVLLDTAMLSVPSPNQVPVTLLPALALPAGPATISGVYESEGTQVPLPPGNWVVMQRSVSAVGPYAGDSRAPVISTTLLRLRGHRVDAAILVQVNPPDTSSAWGLASGCERTDFYATHVRFASDHDTACSYATYVTPWSPNAPAMDESWRVSMQQAVDNGWGMPVRWLAVVYRLTDPVDAAQVRYLFDPAQGGAWQGGTGSEVASDRIARLVAWSEDSWASVYNGFHGRLRPDGGDTLSDWASFSLRPAPAQGEVASDGDRSALKTLSYQLFGSLANLTVAYAYLGDLAAATTLSVVTSLAGGALYYAHEVVWSYFTNPAAGYHDLPGTGLEQPGPFSLSTSFSPVAAASPP